MKTGRNNNYQESTGCRAEFKWHGRVWVWNEFALPASRESILVEGMEAFKDLSQSWCRYELHQKQSLDKEHYLPLLCWREKVNSQGLTWCSHWAAPAGPFFPSKCYLFVYFVCATFVAFFIICWIFIYLFNPLQNAVSEAMWGSLTSAFTVAFVFSHIL